MHNLVPLEILKALAEGRTMGRHEGSILLIDAEGSTALSARLREFDTAGAEALADVLTDVFTPIVDIVHHHGGFVATFTGDGVHAVFPGPPAASAPAALAAGLAVIRRLDELSPFSTPVGPTPLTVRAVVGSGDVEWAIWSSDSSEATQKRAFAFLGSALTEVLRGESIVEGGRVGLGETAATAIGPGVTARAIGDRFVEVVDFDRSDASIQKVNAVDETGGAADFFPPRVVDELGRGEFREVVSGFVQFNKIPVPGAEGDFLPAVLDLVGRHGGLLCDVFRPGPDDPGVTLTVFWGAPKAHESDIDRAVQFLLDVRRLVGESEVRAGLTIDTLYAGFLGAQRQECYTCVGSGVNLAARMCTAAEWGELRVDAGLAARLPRWVGHGEVGDVAYKGFRHPIPTYRVVKATRPEAAVFGHRLVGRSKELESLRVALEPLGRGISPGIISLVGEAGSGKSHLLQELRDHADATPVSPLWMVTEADEVSTEPFGPLRRLFGGRFTGDDVSLAASERFRAMVSVMISRNPDMRTELERAENLVAEFIAGVESSRAGLSPELRFENTIAAMESLLIAESRHRPVVLAIHRGQWLDPSSLEALGRLRDDLADSPVAIIIETRAQLRLRVDRAIEVGTLDNDDVRRVAEGVLDEQLQPEVVDLLAARSGGNPFFIRQMVRYMRDNDLLSRPNALTTASEVGAELPADLRHILMARLDRLGEAVRRTVMNAAVLGREFDTRVLGAMLSSPKDLPRNVDVAERAEVWTRLAEVLYRFRHMLLRDTAYGMQLGSTLETLHEAAANAIETLHVANLDSHAGELAFHFHRAGLSERAFPHYVTAGKAAADGFANAQALELFAKALSLLDPDDQRRYDVLASTERVLALTGDRDAQGEIIEQMGEAGAGDPGRTVHTHLLRAARLEGLGDYTAAAEVVGRTLPMAIGDSMAQDRADLHLMHARLARYAGDRSASRDDAVLAAEEFEALGDRRGAALALDHLGGLAWEAGDYATSIDNHQRAADIARAASETVVEIGALNNLGSALMSYGDYAEARRVHASGVERSRKIGYRRAESDHLDNMGGTGWAVGDYAEAIASHSAALAIRRQIGDAWGVGVSLNNLGGAYRAIGDYDAAARHYAEALEVDRSISRRRGEAYTYQGIGQLERDKGNLEASAAALEQAISIRQELHEVHLLNESKVTLADVFARMGQTARATDLIEEAIASEGESNFSGAVETTAALLACYRVLRESQPERASRLLGSMHETLMDRASRISDDVQREGYLHKVESHLELQRTWESARSDRT